MAEVVPDLQLHGGGRVFVRRGLAIVARGWGRVVSGVGGFVRDVDLLVAEQFAAADLDEERGEAAEGGLQDGGDEWVREEVVGRVELDLVADLD